MAGMSAAGLWGLWRRAGRFDRAVFLLAAAYPVAWILELVGIVLPRFLSFLFLAAFFFAIPYLPIRWLVGNRERLLWSLRNRLVVAYLFIAVVPTLLVVTLGWLTARMFYQQVAAYVVYSDVRQRLARMSALAEEILALPPGQDAAILTGASKEIPGLTFQFGEGEQLLKLQQEEADRFAGLVQDQESVWMRAVVARGAGRERRVLQLSALLDSELVSTLAPDLGPLQFTVTRLARPEENTFIPLGDTRYALVRPIRAAERALPLPAHWFDFEVNGVPKLDVYCVDSPPCGGVPGGKGALFGSVITRTASLNLRLFSEPGEVGDLFLRSLYALAILFLLIEVAALVLGIRLTRTITSAVSELYSATESVKAGDLSHRVRARERDQLGALGESFNAMIGSVSALIEEQKQRQRLENELAIAQQVQAQLFPQELPKLPRLELAAMCRAARVVSGDYYDFIPLDANRVGIAIADISGKGISAALLMASLQAALRSQVLLDGKLSENTAELVRRLNRHLFLNTSSERYATFFYATYDARSGALHYTNAGHLPPLYVLGDKVRKLEEGGMVVGLFDDCVFEQGRAIIEPGGLLVAYSDGLVEPENVYGEQFGIDQLTAEVLRHQHLPPQELAEALVRAAEEWAGTQEQADDMTVIVARVAG
jgi:sigma-B regulation protein RsbU (phosphoserine phosphatase)